MISAAFILSMQAAILPDDPETWTLEYPRIIEEDIGTYYGCLRSRGVVIPATDGPVFEEQHKAHVPMCAKQLRKSMERANATLLGREYYKDYTPERIAATFKTIEYIHISRGRDIDDRLRLHLSEYATYDAAYDQTPDQVSGGEQIAADLPPTSQETLPQDRTDAQN